MRSRSLSYLAGALCLCAAAAWPALARPDDQADAPNGVDVQARGPVHEAYAEPTEVRPEPGPVIPQQPPDPVAEQPPDEKPEGDSVWIPGYWAWDNDTSTFLWVSGFWRTPPPNRVWTPGHWQEVDGGWQWSPGFWAAQDIEQVEYLPPPPPSIDAGPSTPAPDEDSTYVPGCWVYRETRYYWRPGYWVPFNADWCWIPDHYCWTPAGYIFVAGYWDYPLESRGLLFAPVRFEREVIVRRDFVFVPQFVVEPDFLLTALFVRPAHHHFFFGDFFEDRFEREGFIPWVDFRVGKHAFDPNFAFYSHRFRGEHWDEVLRNIYAGRRSGDIPRPPRTWAQQAQVVNKFTTNRTGNVAVNEKISITNLQAVTALAPLNKADNIRITGLAPRAGEGKAPNAPAIKLEKLSKERQAEVRDRVKEFHDFAAAQQKEQAKVLTEGVPAKPTDQPKAVKVQLPKMPARPQEPRTEQKQPAPAPPPPPPAPKHEERPIPPHEPPKPPAPPKTPTNPKEPPATPPKEPPTTPKEPPATPPKEPPTPPKEPPTTPKEPPTPPKEPPTKPPTPPREPPTTPPPKEPPTTPPPTPREPPTPPKEPTPPPKQPPTTPKEPPTPPPAPPKEPPTPPPPKEPPPPSRPPAAPPTPPSTPAPAPPKDKDKPPMQKDKDKPPELVLGA
jgi:YXWGXW repeat-containing protein